MRIYTPNRQFELYVLNSSRYKLYPRQCFNAKLCSISQCTDRSYGQKVEAINELLTQYTSMSGLQAAEDVLRNFEGVTREELFEANTSPYMAFKDISEYPQEVQDAHKRYLIRVEAENYAQMLKP